MKLGDIIFVSEGNFKIRAIARIVGDYKYIEDSDIRYKHFRDVEWLYCDGAVDVEKFLWEKVYHIKRYISFLKVI